MNPFYCTCGNCKECIRVKKDIEKLNKRMLRLWKKKKEVK